MNAVPLKFASLAILPMLAQVSTCNPADIFSNVFNPDVIVRGVGTLEAAGNGTVTIQGSGSVRVTAAGQTGLIIFNAADVEYELNGTGATYWYEGHLIIDGLEGEAQIDGDELRVGLHGSDIELFAEGCGRVTLSGDGTYSTNGGEDMPWPTVEETVEVAAEMAVEYAPLEQRTELAAVLEEDIATTRDYSELIRRVRDELANANVVLAGSGTLDATGSGSAMIVGAGMVEITAEGHTGLVIFDAAEAQFELTGEGRTHWRGGDLIAEGLSGRAFVQSDSLHVVVTGGPMILHAEGTGRARLAGTGTYEVNGGSEKDIPTNETEISF